MAGDEGGVEDVTIWIGLDVGKTEHFAEVCDDQGTTLFAMSVPNDESALTGLIEQAQGHGRPAIVLDQPGSISQLALAVAGRMEVPVAYIPGLVMRRAADLYPGESKTDPRDAHVLADTGRTRRNQVHWLEPSDELLEQLRVLNGFDADLAADATRTANRLRDALTSVSPALERVVGSKLARSAVTALLAKYPTPKALRAAGKSRVHRFLKSRTPRGVDQLVASIWAALDAQTVVVPAQGTLGRVIAELATELGRIQRRRINLGKEIEELFLAHPLGPVLASLPGIGPRTGARILAEIGDGSGFETGAKLAAYAGLAPVTRSSGTSIKGQRRSRRGNHRLKNAMFLAAFASLRSGASKTYYDRKRSEGKKHNAAVVCLARRRCDVILAMLRTQETYRTPDQIQARKAA